MGENSKIEWTDHTFNPWWGCTKVAEGCRNCYADALSRRTGKAEWGDAGTRLVTSDKNWREPLKWNQEAAESGKRARVFCASMADVFEDWKLPMLQHDGCTLWKCSTCGEVRDGALPEKQHVPVHCYKHGPCRQLLMNDIRQRLFALIDKTPNLDWLLLTKRPENIPDMWPCVHDTNGDGNCHICAATGFCPRSNVWLGTSVAFQGDANRNIPFLLRCRGFSPVLFLSMEPLIESVTLRRICYGGGRWEVNCLSGDGVTFMDDGSCGCWKRESIDWVIVGGESGPQARPMPTEAVTKLQEECAAYRVPFFFKQWGGKDKKAAGRELDGKTYSEFPEAIKRAMEAVR